MIIYLIGYIIGVVVYILLGRFICNKNDYLFTHKVNKTSFDTHKKFIYLSAPFYPLIIVFLIIGVIFALIFGDKSHD